MKSTNLVILQKWAVFFALSLPPFILPISTLIRVRFFNKIQDWILKSERIRKWILR